MLMARVYVLLSARRGWAGDYKQISVNQPSRHDAIKGWWGGLNKVSGL